MSVLSTISYVRRGPFAEKHGNGGALCTSETLNADKTLHSAMPCHAMSCPAVTERVKTRDHPVAETPVCG